VPQITRSSSHRKWIRALQFCNWRSEARRRKLGTMIFGGIIILLFCIALAAVVILLLSLKQKEKRDRNS
jgi:hypothetical protein